MPCKDFENFYFKWTLEIEIDKRIEIDKEVSERLSTQP